MKSAKLSHVLPKTPALSLVLLGLLFMTPQAKADNIALNCSEFLEGKKYLDNFYLEINDNVVLIGFTEASPWQMDGVKNLNISARHITFEKHWPQNVKMELWSIDRSTGEFRQNIFDTDTGKLSTFKTGSCSSIESRPRKF
jgi:hypothetical protein